jgi:uncharacterized protein YbjQ (UPF0145 family)
MMADFVELILGAAFVVIALSLGIGMGRYNERKHLASLDAREAANADMLVTNLRHVADPQSVELASLVCGEVVIASDYFKNFVSSYRKLIGGEMRSYEVLVRRARREATLRVIEEARRLGASEVWNLRFETANITAMMPKAPAMCEGVAYGTAVVRRKHQA